MKIRVTLMTENDTPAWKAGLTKEEIETTAKQTWDLFAAVLMANAKSKSERLTVESVELIDDERTCATCRHDLGGGQCARSLERECRDGGFEAWEEKDNAEQEKD